MVVGRLKRAFRGGCPKFRVIPIIPCTYRVKLRNYLLGPVFLAIVKCFPQICLLFLPNGCPASYRYLDGVLVKISPYSNNSFARDSADLLTKLEAKLGPTIHIHLPVITSNNGNEGGQPRPKYCSRCPSFKIAFAQNAAQM